MKKHFYPVVVGIILILFGTFATAYFDLYTRFAHFDKILHTSGGFIVAWFFAWYWGSKFNNFNKFERVVLLAAMGALIGFCWELLEFSVSVPPLSAHQLIHHYLYIGDLRDTLGDLVADTFGAALFGFLSRR